MSFYTEILRIELGELDEQELPRIAVIGLEEGWDSRNLRILSSYLGGHGPGSELLSVYHRALTELNIRVPEGTGVVQELIEDVLRQIVAGETDPVSGAQRVCYELGDSLGIEKLYGLIDTYDDLSGAMHRWSETQSNEELRLELIGQIRQEAARLLEERPWQTG